MVWSLKDRTEKIKLFYSLSSLSDECVFLILETLETSWMRYFPQVYEQLLLLYLMASSKQCIY